MSIFRRIGILVLLLGLVACSSGPAGSLPTGPAAYVPPPNPPRPASCPAPPPPDLAGARGWIGRIAAAPGDVGLVLDDGRGTVVSHAAQTPLPLASAAKVVHLAAYGRAVAQGRVRPDEPVAVADWERWYLPGSDGGAHPAALARLGRPAAVPLDAVVGAMVQESDNAAADYLRDRLGDDALVRAAADTGWASFDLPSYLGRALVLGSPRLAPPAGTPRADRVPVELGLARRYAADPAFRAEQTRAYADAATDVEGFLLANEAWTEDGNTGTAAQLAGLYRALLSGAYGPGADVALRHLAWQPPVPGVGRLGFKSGSYATVLTFGGYLRRDDGTTAVIVRLDRRLPFGVDLARMTLAQQSSLLAATRGGGTLDAIRCVA